MNFEYACGDLGRKAQDLQTSKAFRYGAGEKVRLDSLAWRIAAPTSSSTR